MKNNIFYTKLSHREIVRRNSTQKKARRDSNQG